MVDCDSGFADPRFVLSH